MGGSPFFCAAGPRCSSQLEQHRCWLRQRAVLLHSPGIPLARRLVGDRCRWWRAAQCFFDIRMGCEMCAPYQTPRACRTRMMFVFHPTCWRTTAELQPFMLNLPYFAPRSLPLGFGQIRARAKIDFRVDAILSPTRTISPDVVRTGLLGRPGSHDDFLVRYNLSLLFRSPSYRRRGCSLPEGCSVPFRTPRGL